MGLDRPRMTTPLFVDMEIAAEGLHRSHGEFLGLPAIERKKLRTYWRVKMQKEERAAKDARLSSDVSMEGPKQVG